MKTKGFIAEFLGTALLLCTVVGSGIMTQNTNGQTAIALLANTLATVFILFVLIECFGPISGAHFNPIVTLTQWFNRELGNGTAIIYLIMQLAGGIFGTLLAHAMFELQLFQTASKIRSGYGLWLGEFIATFGLILIIRLSNPQKVAFIVAAYIGAGYWFTSSTSFANPVAVIARTLTDTFTGIAPSNGLAFIVAQLAGGFAGLIISNYLKDS